MEKVLSISIAAYNVAVTLAETLDSLIKAGSAVLDALDIMVVDDESRDETAAIAAQYAAQYPGSVRLIQKKNGGWGSTVNTGIEHAVGKYFRQLDGDDAFETQNLAAYLDALHAGDADLVVTPYLTYDEMSGRVLSREDCNPGCETGRVYQLEQLPAFAPFMHSVALKTECIRGRVQVSEHCFYTDTEFVLKACNQVETVEFLPLCIYRYRRAAAGQSMSLDGMEKHYREQTRVIETLLDYKEAQVHRAAVGQLFDTLLFKTCCWQYLVHLYMKPNAEHKRSLQEYDAMLRERAPAYYREIDIPLIHLLRKTGFWGYAPAAHYKKWRDHRFTGGGRLTT